MSGTRFIVPLASDNPTWGYCRIHGVLAGLATASLRPRFGGSASTPPGDPAPTRSRATWLHLLLFAPL